MAKLGTHVWLFPWLGLFAGVLAVIGASLLGRPNWRAPQFPVTRSCVALWLIGAIVGIVAALKVGDATGVDVVAARGVLLGVLGGAVVVAASRSANTDRWTPALFTGLATVFVTMGRLWLTHSEVSGLAALDLGAAFSVLCLGAGPQLLNRSLLADDAPASRFAVAALAYIVALTAAVLLGFSKASNSAEVYWADVPLLIAGAVSVGCLIGGLAARGRTSLAIPGTVTTAVVLIISAAIAWPVKHWALLGLVALGLLLMAVFAALWSRDAPVGNSEISADAGDTASASASLISVGGAVLIIVAVILSFALWSGYGVGLLVLGAWTAAAWMLFARALPSSPVLTVLSFLSALLIYRLALLQSGGEVRIIGPGQIWDMFAVLLGVVMPLALAELARLETIASRLPPWAVLLEWLVAIVAPVLVLEYVWQPRSLAGVFLGVALGQLLIGRDAVPANGRLASNRTTLHVLSGIVTVLLLFGFLPMLSHLGTPTRLVRVVAIASLSALLLIRLAVPSSRRAAPPAVSREGA